MNTALKKRSPKMDIIRCISLFLVVSVHFFEYSEYTRIDINHPRMYIWTIARTVCITCVPMFIVLSGYLMKDKKPCRKYYLGISRTLGVYILSCLTIYLYRTVIKHQVISGYDLLRDILNFSAAPYGWYVAMYIGLFLLIPFLNLAYNGLESKSHKLIMILTFAFLTSAPTMLNIWTPYGLEYLKTPSMSDHYINLVPDWWTTLYPVTYYYIGCWLKEYGLKINRITNVLLLFASIVVFGLFNVYRCYPGKFIYGIWQDWSSVAATVITVLLFNLLLGINDEKIPQIMHRPLKILSDATFAGYLLSWIFDNIFHGKMLIIAENQPIQLSFFLKTVPLIFLCSLALGIAVNIVYNTIGFAVKKVSAQK